MQPRYAAFFALIVFITMNACGPSPELETAQARVAELETSGQASLEKMNVQESALDDAIKAKTLAEIASDAEKQALIIRLTTQQELLKAAEIAHKETTAKLDTANADIERMNAELEVARAESKPPPVPVPERPMPPAPQPTAH